MPALPYNALDAPLMNPPALSEGKLRIVPLGGLGEVGRNCSVLEMIDPIPKGPSRMLMLDCGVLFPGDDEPGVDLILPDFSYVSDCLDRIDAVVLTHGHEDHIGALPFLLKLRPDIPIVGTKFTLALVNRKLEEHKIENPNYFYVSEGDHLRFGPFALEFLAVNHSIPDAIAVFVKTSAGNIIDTGDFKMDQLPLDNRLTDLQAFSKASKEGVDLFMVDSTNACRPGFVMSESAIGPEIDKIFARERHGAIVATTFASNIHRIQVILNIALKYNRKVVFLGRSMVNNTAVALENGQLTFPAELIDDMLIDIRDAQSLPRDRVCIICTGSQGEELAALGRMSRKEHPFFNLLPGDAAVFASSLVPGNEKAVSGLINRLVVCGVTIYDNSTNKIHASGHACEGELNYIYNVVRAKNVLPIHGEPRMLKRNAEIARQAGGGNSGVLGSYARLSERNTPVILNGCVLDLHHGEVEVVGRIESGYIFVDGGIAGSVTEEDLKQRKIVSQEGFLAISVTIDQDAKHVVGRPKVVAKGIAEEDSAFYNLPKKVTSTLNRAMNDDNVTNVHKLTAILRRSVERWMKKELSRSPMVLPIVSTTQQTHS
jgi:ribonuclease J